MTLPEKSALEIKARRAAVSVGEFVRRSVDFYDPEEVASRVQLAALAAELWQSSLEAAAALDRALASVAETRAQLDRRSAA
jgi:hypothetical protein